MSLRQQLAAIIDKIYFIIVMMQHSKQFVVAGMGHVIINTYL
jgi:hypothetical protein